MTEVSDPERLATEPKVSVIVITYRHEDVLKEAIEGIASQRTDFAFEIIIAEDSSPDGTREVALAMQRKYPALVRTVFTDANKGISSNVRFALDAVRAPYIAFCEGDDFWIDGDKVQRQIAALDRNVDVDLAITRGYRLHADGRRELGWDYGEFPRRLSVEELFAGAGHIAPSASLLWRTPATRNLPGWFDEAGFGDVFLILAASARGGAVYDPAPTVCYRVAQPTSFTTWFDGVSLERRIDHLNRAVRLLKLACAHYGVDPSVMRDRFHDFYYSIGESEMRRHRPFAALQAFAKMDLGLTIEKAGKRLRRIAALGSAKRR
ncbi:MAG: glycosyltransferase family 2 protein [Sphingomicrobium sp.]